MDLASFNALPAGEAERELLACCAAPAWAREVVRRRPYPDVSGLYTTAEAALRALDWSQARQAVAAHPRIGDRPAGAGREAAWSRAEQAGVDGADAATRAGLAAANRAYEERFGHVFLTFASGRTDLELLTAARARLAHDQDTERTAVRDELGRIARLRLQRLLG